MHLTRYPGLFFGLVLVLLTQLVLSLPAQAQQPLRVTLGTATPGGGFQLFGRHLVEEINADSTTIQLEEQPTRGSRQNLTLLAIDIGQVWRAMRPAWPWKATAVIRRSSRCWP